MDGEVFLSRANSTIFLSQTEEGLAISPLARVPQRTHPCVARRSPSPRRAGQGACRGASQGGGSQDGAGPGSGGGGGGARAGRGKEGRGQRGGGAGAGPGPGAGPASPSQSASSERSWQSASPSQRRRRSTHWPRAQGNWAAEHTGQPSSSLWSSHSGKPSQRQAPGMQSISPVAHANWSGEQVGGSAENTNTITHRPAGPRAAGLPSRRRFSSIAVLYPHGTQGRVTCRCPASGPSVR